MSEAQPLVSLDVVPVRFNHRNGTLEFATAKRIFEPYLGKLALPGVLLAPGESLHDAARRALEVKASLPEGYLKQVGAFDGTNRDPRGASISIAFLSAQSVETESSDAFWSSESLDLPFDHSTIIAETRKRLEESLWVDIPLTRALLGERFTTREAVSLKSPTPNVTNASRWFKSWDAVRSVETTKKQESSGRPSVTWEWV